TIRLLHALSSSFDKKIHDDHSTGRLGCFESRVREVNREEATTETEERHRAFRLNLHTSGRVYGDYYNRDHSRYRNPSIRPIRPQCPPGSSCAPSPRVISPPYDQSPSPSPANPSSPSRNLPGPVLTASASSLRREPLYDIISNVDSTFVPSVPPESPLVDPHPTTGRRSPTQATLRVGWGGFEDSFTSRLNCVPFSSVEAISGESAQLIADPGRKLTRNNSAVLKNLSTRWTIAPRTVAGKDGAEVNLTIRFEFANPLYAAVSSAVSETVAAGMIEAFENHARKALDRDGTLRGPL
ncbi:hypothetical protein jhhlp_002512, partial [Lomentospora prolificans]